jgi:hypothetical protein
VRIASAVYMLSLSDAYNGQAAGSRHFCAALLL